MSCWSNEESLSFLEHYQLMEPCIWNPKDANHKDKNKQADAWIRLAELTGRPVKEIKNKKEILMTTFSKYLKKKVNLCVLGSGAGAEEIYIPTWYAYETMESFLQPVYTCNEGINTETQSQQIKEDTDQTEDDPLIRDRTSTVTTPSRPPCPVSFVKRILRQDTIGEWDRRYYDVVETAGGTKLFFPSAAAVYKIVRKINITHHTTQALTGHGEFAFYLNRFKLKENPSCLCQPGVDETVSRLLLECPIFARDRYVIEQKLGIAMTSENLPAALGDKMRNEFLEFCERIVRVVNKRHCDKLL